MAIQLTNDGFLSPTMDSVVDHVRRAHAEIFQFCLRLNRLAHQCLFEAKVDGEDLRELLLSTLMPKGLGAYQAVILLSERGMPAQSRVLLRTLLEVTFRIGAIAKNPEVARAYALEDAARRKKVINKLRMLSSYEAFADKATLDSTHEALSDRIKSQGIKELKTQWFAEQAGLTDFYHSAYSYLSDAVHVSVSHLEDALDLDENGELVGLTYGPSGADIEATLLTAAESLIFCLRGTYSVVDIDSADDVHRMHDEFNALHARYSGET